MVRFIAFNTESPGFNGTYPSICPMKIDCTVPRFSLNTFNLGKHYAKNVFNLIQLNR